MTEELNAKNDPTGLLASLKAANDGRPYLGDGVAVEKLLREFVAGLLERYDEVGHGVLTPEDAANSDRAECLRLGQIFTGQDQAYAPVQGWTNEGLAGHLRYRMQQHLTEEPDDAKLVAQAFGVLAHQVYDALRELNAGASEEAAQQAVVHGITSLKMALLGAVGND